MRSSCRITTDGPGGGWSTGAIMPAGDSRPAYRSAALRINTQTLVEAAMRDLDGSDDDLEKNELAGLFQAMVKICGTPPWPRRVPINCVRSRSRFVEVESSKSPA